MLLKKEGLSMAHISIEHLTFSYDGSYDTIFDDVSFTVDSTWKLGFIGRNGRGKTTLFRLLCNEMEYRGTISSPLVFERFPFEVENPWDMGIQIAEQVAPQTPLWQVVKELNLLQTDEEVLYRPFITLSNGERTKVMLAILFSKENHFLLIDETTNHLDVAGRKEEKKYLQSKEGFILVSHDRVFLDEVIDHVLAINKNGIVVHQGNFSTWWENKQNQDAFEWAENQRLKKDIKRLETSAREKAGWSNQIEKSKFGQGPVDRGFIGHKAAKMMKRSKAVQRRAQEAVEEKEKLLKNIEWADELKIPSLTHHQQRLVVFEEVSLGYEEKFVLTNLSFEVLQGEQIHLKGNNGSGKSTVLKALLGLEQEKMRKTGTIALASGLITSYIHQDTGFLQGDLEAYIKETGVDPTLFKTLLRKLDFSREQFEKPMESYSQGQKKKVLLAQSLCTPAHLYVWDEPLNYLDVFSRGQVEALIQKHQPTILYVEHDRHFLQAITTKEISL